MATLKRSLRFNELVINVVETKLVVLIFHRKSMNISQDIFIDDNVIEIKSQFRYLG